MNRSEALKIGSTVYTSIKPCKYGHVSDRFTGNGECKECARDRQKKSYIYKKDKISNFKSRDLARSGGNKFYFTGPCRRGHNSNRYVSTGKCVECEKLNREKVYTAKYPKEGLGKDHPNYLSKVDAINLGFLKFFTGIKCRKGHLSYRLVSNGLCIECKKEDHLRYKTYNYKKLKLSRGKYKEKNKTKVLAYRRSLYWKTRDKELRRMKRWKLENKEWLLEYKSIRDKRFKERIPDWIDIEKVKEIYKVAYILSKETNIQYSVDHIIPLNGKNVSGLHVHTNLRILPLIENISKHCKWNPDDPYIFSYYEEQQLNGS